MLHRSDRIAEIAAFGPSREPPPLLELANGTVAALRVRKLISQQACRHLTNQLRTSGKMVPHADVRGLRVIGLSHFQAARDRKVAKQYFEKAGEVAGTVRKLAEPFASPFDVALAFLAAAWPAGCQLMKLPTEAPLSPFTVRIYHRGVEIEPHQDILSAESPTDSVAASLTSQFAANVYLSMPPSGGILELFDTDDGAANYTNPLYGSGTISRGHLAMPVRIEPEIGELIIFPCRRIHAVTPSEGSKPRITISFFIGVWDVRSPLAIWA